MKPPVRLLRSLPKPVLFGALLSGALLILVHLYPRLQSLSEPSQLLIAGLTGFWTVRWRAPNGWPLELLAGLIAGILVGGVAYAVRILLDGDMGVAGLGLARAAIAGATGACLARLLHQRVAL